MATRKLDRAPSILPLYARAAAPMIPGASLLPFVPGGGGEIPELDLELAGIGADPGAVAEYAKVCGFALRDHLPPTYPHVLAFPLQMAVLADGGFPFGSVGLVHVENRIEQHRRIGLDEELTIRVRPTALQPHPKGQTFSLITDVSVGGDVAWESESTMLRRGKGGENAVDPAMREEVRSHGDEGRVAVPDGTPASATWKLGGDLGRRYAAVSGDRTAILMHALTAKPLGFPAAIAHGMWTKARALAQLESKLPDGFVVDVRFRKPILLPARVEFASSEEGDPLAFQVRDAKKQTPHLDGRVGPLAAGSSPAAAKSSSKTASTGRKDK